MKNLVDGLDITDTKQNGKCEDCMKGKLTAAPHTRPIAGNEDDAEGLVCVDLWGPSPVHSKGGALYMMLIVDAQYRIKEAYFTHNREAPVMLAIFNKYQKLYKTQTGRQIKRVRFDGEFAAPTEWIEYCAEHGMRVKSTTPHSSEMNGIAERGIRTTTADA